MNPIEVKDSDLAVSIPQELDRLLKSGQSLTFHKGQVLVYEGHHPYGIFVLQSGKVDFYREGALCRERHLRIFPQGPVIGLDCFLNDGTSCCTCRAVEDCQVTFISKTHLIPSLKELANLPRFSEQGNKNGE
jgi:CRP-like cAMP-binding protein